MTAEQRPAPEKDYGLIFDTVSWKVPLDAARSTPVAGFRRFHAGPDERPGGAHPLARTGSLAIYVRSFADGGGENGLHAHDDDAAWVVIRGAADFFAAGGRHLGTLHDADGVLVPAHTSYRFVCHGSTTLVRVAARPPAEPAVGEERHDR